MAKIIHRHKYRAKKKQKKWLWKRLFKLMNNSVFEKTMENVRKHRKIILVTTEKRRNYLMSEQNYHGTNFFHWKCVGNRNEENSNIYE